MTLNSNPAHKLPPVLKLSRGLRGRGPVVSISICLALATAFGARTAAGQFRSLASDNELLHAAEDALNRKDFAAAVKPLKTLADHQPDAYPVWFNLAYAYSGLHQNQEATEAYRHAIQLKPDLFEARLNLGILLLEMSDPRGARDQLEKAAALKPADARTHLYYARALAQSGPEDADAAGKEYRKALELDPKLPQAQFDLAQLEFKQKHYAEALAAFQQAGASDPAFVQAQLGMALASEGLGKHDDAIAGFEKYLAAKPNDLETRFHLARLYLESNQNEKARQALETVYAAKPATPGITAALGDVNAALKNFPDAEKYYRLALQASPNDSDLHRALGRTLLRLDKPDQAEAEFRLTLKLDPHNADAADGLASSLYVEKRYAEVIPLLTQLAKTPTAGPALYFVLATCYDQLRDRRNALEAYEHYLALSHNQNPDQEWQAQQRAKLLRRMLGK
jgi:tetratricopeptide (TPR) repeat protein